MWFLVLVALAVDDDVAARYAGAKNMAVAHCTMYTHQTEGPCFVEYVTFRQGGDQYIDHAVAVIRIAGIRATISMAYRYGKWYKESFDVERTDVDNRVVR